MEENKEVLCKICREPIHPMRLDVLPNTKTCVQCSKEGRKASRYNFSREGEDVGAELSFHDPEEFAKIKKIERTYGITS